MIYAFHGCPGLPEDYAQLTNALLLNPGVPELKPVTRAGYPGASTLELSFKSGSSYLGYSFGCADCVEAAAQDPNAKAVILIAPHLFAEKNLSKGMKTLLGLPVVSDLLLSAVGPSAMKKATIKCVYPEPASSDHFQKGLRYAKPAILRRAMTEQLGRGPAIKTALETLARRKIPVLMICGNQDQVSSEDTQINPLRKLLPQMKEVILESAGHALIWTQAEKLAEEITRFNQGELL
jgi:pimeloyl-ACP methyl ester carboxylesterase